MSRLSRRGRPGRQVHIATGPIGRPTRGLSSLGRALWRRDRGAELVELVLVLPVLLVIAFGILELGYALDKAEAMTTLSREGANIAVRGTALDTVVEVTLTNGVAIGLVDRGGAVASRIEVEEGIPVIKEQVASAGYSALSRIGRVDSMAAGFAIAGLAEGQQLYAVEVFYDHQLLTPLSRIMGPAVPDTIYDVAIF